MQLVNKTILVISPQSWGKMFISKHHYALELARRGNKVFFLNPPGKQEVNGNEPVEIVPSGVDDNLWLVRHRLYFPFNLKFHALFLFHWLMKFHVKRILKKINTPVDIVWSFDLGNTYPLYFFGGKPFKIFHPVDEPLNAPAIQAASGANVILSVTNEILEKYHGYKAPKYLINHGVSESFLLPVDFNRKNGSPVRVGISGNFLRLDIDRDIFLQLVKNNPDILFECWGSYQLHHANIGGNIDQLTEKFIANLQQQKNVKLHGAISSGELAKELHRMDGFLICYDIEKDQSKGTNYHKIMEYLATGKVIVSNNVTAYKDKPDLIQMTKERNSNNQLPSLFKQVMSNLDYHNSAILQQKRIEYAAEHTYSKQIGRIEAELCSSK
jgi:glycosyltransferase involved in cell wall biosynthesis